MSGGQKRVLGFPGAGVIAVGELSDLGARN